MGVSLEMLSAERWIDRRCGLCSPRQRQDLAAAVSAMAMGEYIWVRFQAENLSPFGDYTVRTHDLKAWCSRNCKGDHYVYDHLTVAFEDSADAVLFYLSWSC
jgi:hypothetical protein